MGRRHQAAAAAAAAVAVVAAALCAPAAAQAQDARELWEAGGDASIDRSPDWRPHSAAQTSLADWKLVDDTPPSADDLNRVDSVLDWLETARAERRWARQDDGDAAAPPPPPHPQGNQCQQHLPQMCPKDPETGEGGPDTTLQCDACLAKPENALKLKLYNCSAAETKAFCDPHWPLSPVCDLALAADMGGMTPGGGRPGGGRRLQPGGKGMPGGKNFRAMFQGIMSWSMHMNEQGYFYQCNSLPGWSYWEANLYEFEKGPYPFDSGRQGHTVGVCLPDECGTLYPTNPDNGAGCDGYKTYPTKECPDPYHKHGMYRDVATIVDDYVHYGLAHYWLRTSFVYKPGAPPLDSGAWTLIGVIIALAVLCLLGTLINSKTLARAKVAMPMCALDRPIVFAPSPALCRLTECPAAAICAGKRTWTSGWRR